MFCSTGIDIPALYNVVHYGMPTDLDQFVQESGRVGRDGNISHACVLYHPYCNIGKNMSTESKAFVKLNSCRRQHLLDYFGTEQPDNVITPEHNCCDICTSKCTCSGNHELCCAIAEMWFDHNCDSSGSDTSSVLQSLDTSDSTVSSD